MNTNWTYHYYGSFNNYLHSEKVNDIYKIYSFICKYIIDNPKSKFYFSFNKIAQILGMNYNTVYSSVQRLAADELLTIVEKEQKVKIKHKTYTIYREIKVNWKQAKNIMSILSLDSKQYKELTKRRYKKLAKQRGLTFIANINKVYEEILKETPLCAFKTWKQMFNNYCKEVSSHYYDISRLDNQIDREDKDYMKEEVELLSMTYGSIPAPPDPLIRNFLISTGVIAE